MFVLAASCAAGGCAVTIPADLDKLAPTASTSQPDRDAVHVRYFGVSTLMFTSGSFSIMIDGFFSRPTFPRLVFGPLKPDVGRIKAALSAGNVSFEDYALPHGQAPTPGRLSLKRIFVSHSHFDHAMDVGVVATLTGARISGSESTWQIAQEQGAAGQMDVHGESAMVKDDASPFTVRVFKVDHGPTPLPMRFEGTIDGAVGPLANMGSYRQGINYAYWICHRAVSMLVVPSANSAIELPAAAKGAVDVVFLGIGRLGKQDSAYVDTYWKGAVADSGAGLVIPIHWDDFTRPLDEDLQPMPLIVDNMTAAIDGLKQRAKVTVPRVDVKRLPLFESVPIPHTLVQRPCSGVDRLDNSSVRVLSETP